MKFHYYLETDSLYIDLSEAEGHLVRIDIDRASQIVNLSRPEVI
jgi:uncharacterized protein YuzE